MRREMEKLPQTATFHNPIVEQAADPWVWKHTDGFYYFMHTARDRIELTKSDSLSRIAEGRKKTIWAPEPGGRYSHNLWAPEIHHVQGKWYVYYTANDGEATIPAGFASWRTVKTTPWRANGHGGGA